MSKDLKYVLLPSLDERRRTPKFQPWYRERIKMKYPCHIDTKSWKFVKDGLDDFRDGLPPSHNDIILKPEKGPGPVVLTRNRQIKATASDVRERLKDHQMYFSRELPTAERRRQIIDNYVSTLLNHPMAFFSHFNQILPTHMYERLTKLLEAELLRTNEDDSHILVDDIKDIISTTASIPVTRPITRETSEQTTSQCTHQSNIHHPSEETDTKISSTWYGRSTILNNESADPNDPDELERKQKNPFRWFIEKQKRKQKARGPTQAEKEAEEMEARLRIVAEEFCNWLYEYDSEAKNDVDPSLVRSLFSTEYDTKPPISVPIKVVEMTRIPPEIREGIKETISQQPEEMTTKLPELNVRSASIKPIQSSTFPTDYTKRSEKYRYGAWYLPKHLWQRSLVSEQLRDPQVVKAELDDPARKLQEISNAELASTHGLDSFKEYLEQNSRRIPKLITDVEQYRREHIGEFKIANTDLKSKSNALT